MEATNPDAPIASASTLSHETYMRRALDLAHNGCGNVSPNPLVGCIIVHDGEIVGEGWHKQYGGPHAEVNAINDVANKSILSECTLYVSLEPCSHTGKTPPCADLIISHRLRRVVIANRDPNPLVAGNGIRKLRDAGIDVQENILHEEGYQLNKRFFTYMQKKRPHIILKWAETADGFIARKNHDSKWISDEYSRQLVHKWRTEEDAVMVASGTAWYDNPMLNVRNWSGRDPLRVVIDRYLKLGSNQHLFDGSQKTICYNLSKDEQRDNVLYVKLDENQMLESIIRHLYAQNVQSVIVEGGAQLLSSFIRAGLWDEARIFVSPNEFKTGIPAPDITGELIIQKKLANDWLKIMEPLTHHSPLTKMAEELVISKSHDKRERYQALLPQLEAMVEGEEDLIANLANVAAALKQTMNFFWVGFYFVKRDQLVLGPFQGPIACTRIGFGKGVCGTAWKDEKTIVVPNVDEFPGHIACSSAARSEIVLPAFKNNKVALILDVDSDRLNDFDADDENFLEKVIRIVEKLL